MENLRQKVLDAALRKGYKTIESFAEAIGMTRTGFNKMFAEQSIKLITLSKICEKLEVPYTFFFEELNTYMVNDNNHPYNKKSKKSSKTMDEDDCQKKLQASREEIISLQNQLIQLMKKN